MQYDVDSAYNFKFFDKDLPTPKYGKRKNLLYFSGSLLPKTAPFRAIFKEACDSFAGCTFKSSGRRSFNVSAATTSLLESTFCAILGGDTRASKRFFDALHAFCIPVIFDPLLALPFAESIPYNDFVVHASFIRKKEKVVETMEKLRSLPEVEIIRMQTALRSYHNYLSYLSPSIPNAIDMIVWRLYVRGEVLINKSSSKKEFYNISIDEWINKGCPTHWSHSQFNPLHQHKWVYDNNDVLLVSFLIRMEDYDNGINFVYHQIQPHLQSSVTLDTVNQTRKNESSNKVELTEEQKNKIYHVFKKDFELFGYKC